MPCSRREFLHLVQLAVGSSALASALPGCDTGGQVDGSVAVTAGQAVMTFAQFPALATVGGGAIVSAGGVPIAVIRTAAATAVALSAICTHAGCTVGYSGDRTLHCACHGSQFSASGTVLQGPANAPLEKFAAVVNTADVTVSGL